MSNDARYRVLVAEAHALKRAGMMFVVKEHPALVIAGEVGDTRAACQFVTVEKPDLVVCNLELPGDVLVLLRAAPRLHPPARWIVMSPSAEPLTLQRALRAGAHGCLLEEEGPRELYAALGEVLRGETFLSARVSALLISHAGHRPKRWEMLLPTLSDREWQVFRRLGRGQSVAEMARELNLSVKSIETFVRRMQEKLQLAGAPQLRAAAETWMAGAGERGCFEPDGAEWMWGTHEPVAAGAH